MDTDRTRNLARLERLEQEVALLRKVEKAARADTMAAAFGLDCDLADALDALDAWRKEHATTP